MKIGIFIKNKDFLDKPDVVMLLDELRKKSFESYLVSDESGVFLDTDLLLSIGGDGTFLSASKRVGNSGIPILGVNSGRVGFLSENMPEEIIPAILKKEYVLEDRHLLYSQFTTDNVEKPEGYYPYSLNEVTVHRAGAAMLGVVVSIEGEKLPTYWADGLVVATSSGSTAYSLSVGGPICTPGARVLIISPIAPHNLNVRPLVVPDTTRIHISLISRDPTVMFTMDNRNIIAPSNAEIDILPAPFTLKRVKLKRSEFIKALTNKLYWGEDVRNENSNKIEHKTCNKEV